MALNSLKKRKRNRDSAKAYFSEEEQAFLRKKAALTKKSVSQLIREYTVMGIFAEKLEEIEERLEAASSKLDSRSQSGVVPIELIKAVFFVESMMMELWQKQDVQVIYRAQQEVSKKIEAMRAVE